MKLKKLIAALALVVFAVVPFTAPSQGAQDDRAATYKAKCAACHGATAEKSFDAGKEDTTHVKAILEGVKPKMPAYKSYSEDQAKALVEYMRSLKK